MKKLIMIAVGALLGASWAFAQAGCANDASQATTMIQSSLGQKIGTWWASNLVPVPFMIYANGTQMMAEMKGYGSASATVCAGNNSNSLIVTTDGYTITISKSANGQMTISVDGQTASLTAAPAG